MKCPICNVNLQMTERQGIEIDYCSQCRGVWLDRGELDKIIEKSGSENISRINVPNPSHQSKYHDTSDHHSNQGYGFRKKYKREGLLGELFDF